ncbi:MAG: ABC transporter substrate-binding protein, partial [Bdellovibrio sp.]
AHDGYRHKNGQRLSLPFTTTAGDKVRETVETFLQNQWKEIGVEVIIKNEPARVFFGDTLKKREYALGMYAWSFSLENIPRSTLHSSAIPNEKNGWSGQNNPGWSNPKVDQAIEQMETEFDPKKRNELAYEIEKYYTEDVPVIPLYYRSDVAVNPTTLRNFELTGHQFYETNSIENWDVKVRSADVK